MKITLFNKNGHPDIVTQYDRKIAIKDPAAMFIAGLGLSIAFLGYNSDVRAVTCLGIIIACGSFVVEASAMDDRDARRRYI